MIQDSTEHHSNLWRIGNFSVSVFGPEAPRDPAKVTKRRFVRFGHLEEPVRAQKGAQRIRTYPPSCAIETDLLPSLTNMPPSRSWRYWLLLAGASLWMVLLLAPPWLASRELPFSDASYACFASLCHQLPERSFQVWGNPVAVCARCFGLYFGFWAGLLLIPTLKTFARHFLAHPRLLILFGLPMAIDLLLSNSATSRFVSGTVASFPVALLVWVAVESLQLRPLLKREVV
jgi:uncharacterized membrane protein